MANWTLLLLALTGLLAAGMPLVLVWRSRDPDKFRKLAWLTVFLTFDLIVFGAFTRLTDSGLGCPDWPGCYGLANPFLAHEQITAAQTLMPTGPVTVLKAWVEMIHRFLASAIGLLCVVLMAWSWLRARVVPRLRARMGARNGLLGDARAELARRGSPWLPTGTFLLVCVQGAFGAWTVTLKLQPAIVTTHLVLGMLLLVVLTWLGCRMDAAAAPVAANGADLAPTDVRVLAGLAAFVLALQIALGGWVSTNYATLACTDFPLCQGALVPEMDFSHGFTLWRELGKTAAGHYLPFAALTAIHWVHRNFALVVVIVLGLAAWRAWPHARLRPLARALVAALALQACTGIATVYLSFPLAIAVLHNAGAALLVLLVTMLNYRASHLSVAVQRAPAQPRK
jgi:cytochrome c oxidase assembly protein subunit 15